MDLHRKLFLLLRLWDGCGLLDPFDDFPRATNNVMSSHARVAAAARRRHGLEVEDDGHLKDTYSRYLQLVFHQTQWPMLGKY
jgi:hypothetical protein